MFFQGSLQEGIATAIQQQKRVICFVHDDSESSQVWEKDGLAPMAGPLADHAVVLKIAKDSQEATFLAAICPLDTVPMVVVISKGRVKEAIKPPMSVQDFRRQLLTAMDLKFTISQPRNQDTAVEDHDADHDRQPFISDDPVRDQMASTSRGADQRPITRSDGQSRQVNSPVTTLQPPSEQAGSARTASASGTPSLSSHETPGGSVAAAATSRQTDPASTPPTASGDPSWADERRRRMRQIEAEQEAEKKRLTEAARKAAQTPGTKAYQQAKLQEEVRKRQRAAAEERQRVLDNIEADKQERRRLAEEKAQERQAARDDAAGASLPNLEPATPAPAENTPKAATAPSRAGGPSDARPAPEKARLQLRFADGRVERVEFSASDPLTSVRAWIKQGIEPKIAGHFAFRQMVGVGTAPQISEDDEKKTLANLGLAPSATLIVRPVTLAAQHTMLGRLVGMLLAVPRWLIALVLMLLDPMRSMFGSGTPDRQTTSSRNTDRDAVARSTGTEAKAGDLQGLEERKKRRDRPNFYNGNQTNVLPRDDDNDEDGKE